ncbi:FAD-dependent monooxygenase ausM [Fusarium culmorum]|uniref:FAD-dependent monooxygenase ausM n=1 Tax=Fusarium culmorum TaxID=5516 RepID=A0A2T4GS61_FUSCU|nr:FAD-dependent monooxygenase ausM [Fusarium culmorum]
MSSKVEVIIVGGGVSGLTFAHCLRNAGINYVLLEKGAEICFRGGASIGLMPHGLRILDQLGVCDQILGLTAPMHTSMSRLPSGKKFRESQVPAEIAKRHGYPVTFFEREELLRVLYENIPDKENIQTSQQVTDLQLGENLVTVKTNQGRTWKAPIVVGADGIHSLVRKSIWKEIDQRTEGASLSQSQAIVADYYCTFGVSVYKSDDPEFIEGAGHVNFDHSRSTVVINSSRNKHFWFLILKFNERKTYPNIPRFGEKDMEKMAAENKDLMVTEHTSFADLWRMRTKCAMVPLEEVVFDVWHTNRLVLLGDSAHKVTPNAGQGGNSAIESAAVLVNLLHKAKTSHGNLENLNTAEITNLFQKYHANRKIRVKEMSQTSAFLTRLHAQDNRMLKVVGRHVFPFLGDDFDLNAVSNYIIGGPTLDFIQVKTKPALIPWEGWTLPDSLTARGNGVRSTLATLFVLAVFSRLLSTKMIAQRDLQPLLSTVPNANSLSGLRGIQPPAVVLSIFGLGTTRLWATLAILLNTLSMASIIASESFRVMHLRLISARYEVLLCFSAFPLYCRLLTSRTGF